MCLVKSATRYRLPSEGSFQYLGVHGQTSLTNERKKWEVTKMSNVNEMHLRGLRGASQKVFCDLFHEIVKQH